MPRVIACCPETPYTGSMYCFEHRHLDLSANGDTVKRPRIVINIDIINMRSSTKVVEISESLPSNDDESVLVGCKKPCNIARFQNRTAGIMALVRPCGIIVDACEMLTCESSSQLFVQLLRLRCDSGVDFSYLGYDRSCEFEPFLRNLSKKGNEGADILLENTEYLVDRFHIKNHTNPKCVIANPLCAYHPDLPKFFGIQNANTECAEQCFSWLKKFKNTMKYMSKYKFLFFLKIIVNARNVFLEKRAGL